MSLSTKLNVIEHTERVRGRGRDVAGIKDSGWGKNEGEEPHGGGAVKRETETQVTESEKA